MITNFATVTLWVEDFDKALHFYSDVLGLDLLTRPGEIPQYAVGSGILVLAKGRFVQPQDAFPPDFPQVTLAVDDLNAMAARLQAKKIEIEASIQERRDSCWLKLRDPDGNLIELVEVKQS